MNHRTSILLAAIAALAAAAPAGAAPTSTARAVDRARAQAGPGQDFNARSVMVDRSGAEHVRLDRTYRGLNVLGGDVVVHSAPSGAAAGTSQTLRRDLALDTTPAVGRADAVVRARSRFSGGIDSEQSSLVVDALQGAPALAWEVVLSGTRLDGTPSELHVLVDARDGGVRRAWDGVETAGTGKGFQVGTVSLETMLQKRGGYVLQDPTRGAQSTCDMRNGTNKCTTFTDADNTWGSGTLADRASLGVDAQYGAAMTWDFYATTFGRRGIANDGQGAVSRVHYSKAYNNAFWRDSCFCMTYGDGDGVKYGPFTSLDVAGHEMSHGVTAKTAGLVYSGESGGLNEATSDIFGTMVEFYANNATDPGDYLVGEKVRIAGGGFLRNMAHPSADGASLDCWGAGAGTLDVHYSSGIANHFFYLLSEGSAASPTCDGKDVAPIEGGRVKAARIWYDALTIYMTTGTDYAGARRATLDAASEADRPAVAAAWDAVGVTA